MIEFYYMMNYSYL